MKRSDGWRYGLAAGVVLLVMGSMLQGSWSGDWGEVIRSLPVRAAIIIPVLALMPSVFGVRIGSRPR